MINQTVIKSGCYPFELPLHREAGEKWKPYPIFHGSTAALNDLSCHASTLVHGFSPHPPHEHKEEEILFVLSGEVDIILKDYTVPAQTCFYRKRLQKNQFAYYPANFAHSLETTSKEPATYLMFRWCGSSFPKNNMLNFCSFDSLPLRHEANNRQAVSPQLIFEEPTRYLEMLHCHTTRLAPGAGYSPHADSYDVAILLLEGEVQTIGQNIKAPGVIFYETGKPHGILNPTGYTAKYLVFEFHRHSLKLLQKTSSLKMNKNIKPSLIVLDASSACQLRCPSCPTGQGMTLKTLGAKFLKFIDFKNLIDANPWISAIELSNWGEIFLNPEIISILEYGFKKNIALQAYNGVNLNTVSNDILEALVKYQFQGMTVSLDGASNDTYKIYRVGGDFEKVIAHIRIINAFKQRYQTHLPKMVWQFVAFGHNEHEIAKARNMAVELKMDFYVKLSFGDLYTGEIFSPIKNRELIRRESGVDCADRQEYLKKHGERYLQKASCAQLWKSPHIHADGRLLGCCTNYKQDYGNVFEEGLLECINNEKINYARQMLMGQEPPREDIPCSKCFYYQTMYTNMEHESISTTRNVLAKRDAQIAVKNKKIKKGVIYTCITGGYDLLINHTYIDNNWDYVCFADNSSISNLDNSVWQIKPLVFDKLDNIRNQRWHKLHPHILFPEYKKSIWLDANINILNKDVFTDIDRAMDQSRLISIAPHPDRNCIYDELIACISLGKDDEGVMRKQMTLIRSAGLPEQNGLFETCIMYRQHHNYQVIKITKDWWWWIENYSRRDQLSLTYVLWKHKLEVKPLTDISYRYSDGIEFINNTNHLTKEELIVQKAQLQQEIHLRDWQISGLNQVVAERDGQISGLNQAVAECEGQIANLNQVVARYNEALRTIEEIRGSSSWRITTPMRYVSSKIKNIAGVLKLLPGIVRFGGGVIGSAKKAWRVFSREGWSGVRRRIFFVGGNRSEFISSKIRPDLASAAVDRNDYGEWVRLYDTLTEESRATMRYRIDNFVRKPLISVVMPTYNSKPEWLIEAIESIRKQIYPFWELCIADDASTDKGIRPILERYAKEDPRIKIIFREKNGHISTASNSALGLATGEWIALLDHDDLLAEHALFWVADAINQNPSVCLIYSDEDKIDDAGKRFDPYFKCDWNVDLFYSHNLISHLGVYRADILTDIGGFREGLEGSQDYDLALRFVERIESKKIHHIPRVLYHWRTHAESTAKSGDTKPYAMLAGEHALNDHFQRQNVNARTELIGYGYRVRYALPDIPPLVSLIILTKNSFLLLQRCIESILKKTTYPNYEILIVDNGSDDPATLQYIEQLQANPKIRVVRDNRQFNYSALNNAAVKLARGEIVGLLNNDLEVISHEWLSEMISHAMRPGVGAVGARLWYPNNTLQHGGVVIGLGGVAGHAHYHMPGHHHGYFGRAALINSFSAVSAACLVIRKDVYDEVGGMNENDLQVAYNDVDLCLRVGKAGYRNVWTPYAELYHHESATRGYEDTPERQKRFAKEVAYMKQQWGDILLRDPAYSPNLTLDYEDFSLAWPPRVNSI